MASADVEMSLKAKFEAVLPHLDERSVRLVLRVRLVRWGTAGSRLWRALRGRHVEDR